jgi:methylated-DNA-[protein]-cysteine S-methyltransferase
LEQVQNDLLFYCMHCTVLHLLIVTTTRSSDIAMTTCKAAHLRTISPHKTKNLSTAAQLLRSCRAGSLTTPFQRRVYEALCRVPVGKVTTYKHLAAAVGCGSCQAVGQALRRNPHAPAIPCHRVVASDGSLGGFGGCTTGSQIQNKRDLLRLEGVLFCGGGNGDDLEVDHDHGGGDSKSIKIDPRSVWTFPATNKVSSSVDLKE